VQETGITVDDSDNMSGIAELSATVKKFVIIHPTKKDYKLQHSALEGPEHGVYIRGKLNIEDSIILPNYWEQLVDTSTISVHLTPIRYYQKLYVDTIQDKIILIKEADSKPIYCFYEVRAERKDVDKLEVEVPCQ